jgi:EmrB/QacA subfamily drug resistance transporter
VTRAELSRSTVGLRSERGPILLSVMLATGLVAMDSTIIATAVPSVVADLGGYSQFPWLFSIYLLTQAVTVPLYGKFADSIGRRPVMILGIIVFLAGSLLCAAAWSMPSLIIARGIQGIGAGAVLPMSITIVGDIYSVQERAKVQGYLASVWGAAAVLGPSLGGVFSQYLSWRWIFLINLPLGAVALWVLARSFQEQVVRTKHTIDFTGAILLTGGCSLLILGLLEGGEAWAWRSGTSLGVFSVAALLLVAFAFAERSAPEPVLPLWVFRRRVLVGGNLAGLVVGTVMIGMSSFIPNYAQGVLGTGPVMAGFVLASLSIAWPLSAAVAGHLYVRIGFRDTALIGGTLVIIGTGWAATLGEGSSLPQVAAACFVVGAGLGLMNSPVLVAVQSVVGWDRRGVVTGANMFFRSMGSAVGAALFGAISNATISARFHDAPTTLAGLPDPSVATRTVLGGEVERGSAVGVFVRGALYDATHHVLIAVACVAVLAVVFVSLIPRRTTELIFD